LWYPRLMVELNAHFDGKVIVPDEPLALKPNQRLRIQVEPIDAPDSPSGSAHRLGLQRDAVHILLARHAGLEKGRAGTAPACLLLDVVKQSRFFFFPRWPSHPGRRLREFVGREPWLESGRLRGIRIGRWGCGGVVRSHFEFPRLCAAADLAGRDRLSLWPPGSRVCSAIRR